jgi:hypothetical protein
MLLLKNSEPKELMYLQLFAMSLMLNKGRIWLTKLSRWISSFFCLFTCFTIVSYEIWAYKVKLLLLTSNM